MQTLKFAIVAALIAVIGTACGPKLPPGTSFEAKAAIRGDQLVQGLRATLPLLKAAACTGGSNTAPNCVPPAELEKVVGHITLTFKIAEQLGVALRAVDDAKTAAGREEGMARAREFLASLQTSLTQATITPSGEAARQNVVAILGSVTTLLFAISAF